MAEQAERVDVVPQADEVIIEAEDFTPSRHLVDVLRHDGGSCHCGVWHFYSARCGHIYQEHQAKCGAKRTGRGTKTAFCPKTPNRILISNVKIDAPCPSAACQDD